MRLARLVMSGCLMVLFAASVAGAETDRSDWTNLIGLTAVSETVSISLNLEGAEDFDLNADRLQVLVRERLKREGLLSSSREQLPKLNFSILGHSGGGGGAEYRVEMTLTAQVQSPFIKERTIHATIWQGMESDRQLMYYDPIKKKILEPPGPIRSRVETTLLQLLESFIADLRKANPKMKSGRK